LKQQQDIKALELTWFEEKQQFSLNGVFRRNLVRGVLLSYSYLKLSISIAHSYSSTIAKMATFKTCFRQGRSLEKALETLKHCQRTRYIANDLGFETE
jgi:hypothetical protein